MKNIKILLVMFILDAFACISYIYSDNRIMLYLKHAPEEIINQCIAQEKGQSAIEKINQENTPGQISTKLLKNGLRSYLAPSVSGMIGVYGGYMDISNKDGLMVFPRRQESLKIYIAIAPSIQLVKVKGETISHREFMLGEESKLYLFERKVDKKKIAYWDIKETKIPDDKKINPITLVIFAKTKNIYVPEGDFLVTESSHLILPALYVIGNFDQEKILLQALDLKRYFECIAESKKKISDTNIQKMITNT